MVCDHKEKLIVLFQFILGNETRFDASYKKIQYSAIGFYKNFYDFKFNF